MTPPDYKTKTIKWQIETRDLANKAKIYHLWFPLYQRRSLEDAKESLSVEKRDSHSPSEEVRIVRIEITAEHFVETI
jgi:hypothetical protein